MLQETRRPKSSKAFSISGFNVFETRMDTAKDGIMTIVSRKYQSAELPSVSEDMNAVRISLENGASLFIANLYIPPNRSSLACLGRILGSLQGVSRLGGGDELVVAGDLNLKLDEFDSPFVAMNVVGLKKIKCGATRLNNEIDYVYTNC